MNPQNPLRTGQRVRIGAASDTPCAGVIVEIIKRGATRFAMVQIDRHEAAAARPAHSGRPFAAKPKPITRRFPLSRLQSEESPCAKA